ncbi:YhgE/Pip domain-containing protein, partial [Bacillus vallismortis]|nr:YhgE/Pip domain-containing protein [Bacillus vallismortis]
NSKFQQGSEKAAKSEKIINALDLTKLETAVNNLKNSETSMKEFHKQLTDFENSLKNRDQAFKNHINSSDFLTAEKKSQMIHYVE